MAKLGTVVKKREMQDIRGQDDPRAEDVIGENRTIRSGYVGVRLNHLL